MAENENSDTSKKKVNKRSKFLRFGKFFLIVVVLLAQAFIAYAVVDKKYPEIYSLLNGLGDDNFVVYKMDELIVNPAGSQGQRFLVVEISMELTDSGHIEIVDKHIQRIKHAMNEALSARTVDELVQFQERERLRLELKNIVNREIGTHSVRNLYYTKYVMQ